MRERLAFPTTGPHDRPWILCDWVIWLEEELAGLEDREEAVTLRRALARAHCWLFDARFPEP